MIEMVSQPSILDIILKANNYSNSYTERFMNKYGYRNLGSKQIKESEIEEFICDHGLAIKFAGIDLHSCVDGPGLRYTLFTQGCIHNCDGCHNPGTHDFNGGEFISIADLFEGIKHTKGISGVTLSGGDPLFSKNYKGCLNLCKRIRSELSHLNIWLYTGYTYEQIPDREILQYIDVLVDGRFDKNLKSLSLNFRGSSNQRIINVPKSLREERIVEWK